MNLLDAHIIVHIKYAGALANHRPGKYDLLFRPYSDYGSDFDKHSIVDAFKLFYSHMILFNTRTNQEFEQYQISLQYLDSFLPDNDMERVRKSAKILLDKSLRGKLLNASARDYAQREINYYNSIAFPPYSWADEMDLFLPQMLDYKKFWLQEYQQHKGDQNVFWQSVEQYCDQAYKLANIPQAPNDKIFFAPFEQLRRDVLDSPFKELLTPYADYIMTTQ